MDASGASEEDMEGAELLFLNAYLDLLTPPLTSPRARYTQADVQSDTPAWALLRANARETAMFRFLGMPRFLFDDLAELMRPHLETYDRSITRRGKPCTFDHKDVLGVCLRYTQLQQRKWMEQLMIEFGTNETVITRALSVGLRVLHMVLEDIPDCAVRYPTLKEARMQWKGMMAQHGKPPWDESINLCLAGDGTYTRAMSSGDTHTQRLQKGAKGVGWNSVFVMDAGGCVADAVYAQFGCYTDERLSREILKRHWDPLVNPHRLGMLLDSGWSSRIDFSGGAPDEPPMRMRPQRADDTRYGAGFSKKYVQKCSAKATVYRQFNEHGNGQLKRSYPVIERPRRVKDRVQYARDMEICIRLNNLRCVYTQPLCAPLLCFSHLPLTNPQYAGRAAWGGTRFAPRICGTRTRTCGSSLSWGPSRDQRA